MAAHLRALRIPFDVQHPWHPCRRFRADIAIPSARLLCEIDGGLFISGRHSRGASREADYERDAEALLLGWRTLRCSPRQVRDGRAVGWIETILRNCRPESGY